MKSVQSGNGSKLVPDESRQGDLRLSAFSAYLFHPAIIRDQMRGYEKCEDESTYFSSAEFCKTKGYNPCMELPATFGSLEPPAGLQKCMLTITSLVLKGDGDAFADVTSATQKFMLSSTTGENLVAGSRFAAGDTVILARKEGSKLVKVASVEQAEDRLEITFEKVLPTYQPSSSSCQHATPPKLTYFQPLLPVTPRMHPGSRVLY